MSPDWRLASWDRVETWPSRLPTLALRSEICFESVALCPATLSAWRCSELLAEASAEPSSDSSCSLTASEESWASLPVLLASSTDVDADGAEDQRHRREYHCCAWVHGPDRIRRTCGNPRPALAPAQLVFAAVSRDASHRRRRPALAQLAALGALAALTGPGAASAGRDRLALQAGRRAGPCYGSLQTTAIAPDGSASVQDPPLPRRRRIDCFYVYPTVSEDPGINADLSVDPEQLAIARYQASRFSQRCRVFAPMYRQLTLTGDRRALAPARGPRARLWGRPRRLARVHAQVQQGGAASSSSGTPRALGCSPTWSAR